MFLFKLVVRGSAIKIDCGDVPAKKGDDDSRVIDSPSFFSPYAAVVQSKDFFLSFLAESRRNRERDIHIEREKRVRETNTLRFNLYGVVVLLATMADERRTQQMEDDIYIGLFAYTNVGLLGSNITLRRLKALDLALYSFS